MILCLIHPSLSILRNGKYQDLNLVKYSQKITDTFIPKSISSTKLLNLNTLNISKNSMHSI